FYKIEQRALYGFVGHMLKEITLPVYLYNNPDLTKIFFELKTVGKLLDRDNILGIKDSSGDMVYYQKLQSISGAYGKSLFMGPEELLMESLILGGSGGIPGGANIFPQLYVDLYKTIKSGNWKGARDLQLEIIQIS